MRDCCSIIQEQRFSRSVHGQNTETSVLSGVRKGFETMIDFSQFKRYMRPIITIHVNSRKDGNKTIIETKEHCEVVYEPCNPVKMFIQTMTGLQLVKMKPCETVYEFQDTETEQLWNQMINEGVIRCF